MEDKNNLFEIIIGKSQLDKHLKYKNYYQENDLFFGLGIENEKYLEFENKINFNKQKFIKNRNRERYSVDYNTNYNQDIYMEILKYYADNIFDNQLPLLLNSHSFTHSDYQNNSITLYTKMCENNPKYLGETLFDKLQAHCNYFKEEHQKTFVFDGDTIEIITTDFYNVTINKKFRKFYN
jgi:hypothetical protein